MGLGELIESKFSTLFGGSSSNQNLVLYLVDPHKAIRRQSTGPIGQVTPSILLK